MEIWWVRRDLRLEDNPALQAAIGRGTGVAPVFILDEELLAKAAPLRRGFLIAGLRALDEALRLRGARLIVRRGDPAAELRRLAEECGAQSVFAGQDISPYARRRDAAVGAQLDLRLVHNSGAHPTRAVSRADGRPYTVFTPYSRAWRRLPVSEGRLPAPRELAPVPDLPSVDLPCLPEPLDFPAGELEGQRRLAAFLDGPIYDYAGERNRLDLAGTSTLSPYFRFGMLSARQAAAAARRAAQLAPEGQARAGCETWLNELIWREFYQSILYHFPAVLKTAFRPGMRAIAWRNAPQDLLDWQAGLTGYPVVDAGMRQLAATGWMHNRARMIAASFLVKHLLIDWRAGERWFMQHLIDGDPAANNGGWQWIAGTGADAAPYFRVFNPTLQGIKFDPDGVYVRRWVPELARVPREFIHAPWKMPAEIQREAAVMIGRDYPAPLVEHGFARRRALQAYSGRTQ